MVKHTLGFGDRSILINIVTILHLRLHIIKNKTIVDFRLFTVVA